MKIYDIFICNPKYINICEFCRTENGEHTINETDDNDTSNLSVKTPNKPNFFRNRSSNSFESDPENFKASPFQYDLSIINPKCFNCSRARSEAKFANKVSDSLSKDKDKNSSYTNGDNQANEVNLASLEKSLLAKIRGDNSSYRCDNVIKSIINQVRLDMLNNDLLPDALLDYSSCQDGASEDDEVGNDLEVSSCDGQNNLINNSSKRSRGVLEKDSSVETVIDREEYFKRCEAKRVERQVSFAEDDVAFNTNASDCSNSSASHKIAYSGDYPTGAGSDRYPYQGHRTQQPTSRRTRDRNEVEMINEPLQPMDHHHHQYHHGHHREGSVKRGTFTRSLSNNETPGDEKTGDFQTI